MLGLTIGCTPLTDRFDEAVATAAANQPATPPVVVTEADLTHLPAPVGRWLRHVGVVGRPRVRNFVVDMHAQLNRGPGEPWMETPVLQVSFVANPTRGWWTWWTSRGTRSHAPKPSPCSTTSASWHRGHCSTSASPGAR